MRIASLLFAALWLSLAPAHATAPIAAEAGTVWLHEQSQIAAPPKLGDMLRRSVNQFGEGEHNVFVRYSNASDGSFATLFLFRTGLVSPAIWADRSMAAMLANKKLGDRVEGSLFGGVFTPPNANGTDSGVMITTAVAGTAVKSDGFLLFAHDVWLVKLRLTSSLDQAQARALMLEMIKELKLGQSPLSYPKAHMIDTCPDPLRTGKNAKLEQHDAVGSLMLGAMLIGTMEAGLPAFEPLAEICRDALSTGEVGVYRKAKQDDAYLLAMGDAGTTVHVGLFKLGAGGGMRRSHLAVMSDGVTQSAFGPFTRLPAPTLVRGFVADAAPIVSRNLISPKLGNTTITLPARQ